MATLLQQQAFTRVRHMNPMAVHAYMDKHGHRSVLIYSGQWGSFWRAGGAGYTHDPNHAGIYDLKDAYERTLHCGPEKAIHYELID